MLLLIPLRMGIRNLVTGSTRKDDSKNFGYQSMIY